MVSQTLISKMSNFSCLLHQFHSNNDFKLGYTKFRDFYWHKKVRIWGLLEKKRWTCISFIITTTTKQMRREQIRNFCKPAVSIWVLVSRAKWQGNRKQLFDLKMLSRQLLLRLPSSANFFLLDFFIKVKNKIVQFTTHSFNAKKFHL